MKNDLGTESHNFVASLILVKEIQDEPIWFEKNNMTVIKGKKPLYHLNQWLIWIKITHNWLRPLHCLHSLLWCYMSSLDAWIVFVHFPWGHGFMLLAIHCGLWEL